MVKRLFLPLAVAAVGFVSFGLPLAVSAEETCSCAARKEWVAIRAAELRAEREAAARAEAAALAAGQKTEEASAATGESSSVPTVQEQSGG